MNVLIVGTHKHVIVISIYVPNRDKVLREAFDKAGAYARLRTHKLLFIGINLSYLPRKVSKSE